jgi:hypothetical protein
MMNNTTVLTFDEVLAKHLQDHTIPIHTTMVGACKIAIECMNKGDFDTMIELPYNVHFYRTATGQLEQAIQAFKVVMFCHLDEWLDKDIQERLEKFIYP